MRGPRDQLSLKRVSSSLKERAGLAVAAKLAMDCRFAAGGVLDGSGARSTAGSRFHTGPVNPQIQTDRGRR
jgi:hypothetical protein